MHPLGLNSMPSPTTCRFNGDLVDAGSVCNQHVRGPARPRLLRRRSPPCPWQRQPDMDPRCRDNLSGLVVEVVFQAASSLCSLLMLCLNVHQFPGDCRRCVKLHALRIAEFNVVLVPLVALHLRERHQQQLHLAEMHVKAESACLLRDHAQREVDIPVPARALRVVIRGQSVLGGEQLHVAVDGNRPQTSCELGRFAEGDGCAAHVQEA
mmetsp:Transcript_67529/g.140755  ORF Transcript_67529/g.140755 Transcript_67529/m.140755 type:complete len:209 (-) Transcript_67529:412-1038(-)